MVSPVEDISSARQELPSHLVVFDGACVMCSSFARFIARFDRQRLFRFATAQSPIGEALYRSYGLRVDDYETNLVLIYGAAFTKLESITAVLNAMGWPWRAARVANVLPQAWRSRLYDLIARNRHAIFGRKDRCEIPSGPFRERMLD